MYSRLNPKSDSRVHGQPSNIHLFLHRSRERDEERRRGQWPGGTKDELCHYILPVVLSNTLSCFLAVSIILEPNVEPPRGSKRVFMEKVSICQTLKRILCPVWQKPSRLNRLTPRNIAHHWGVNRWLSPRTYYLFLFFDPEVERKRDDLWTNNLMTGPQMVIMSAVRL